MEVFSVDANRKALLRCSSIKNKNKTILPMLRGGKTLRTGDQVTEVEFCKKIK